MSRTIAGILVLLASTYTVGADQRKSHPNPEINVLRTRIKALQIEEKATLKGIKAQYDSILYFGKLSKAQLEELKTALRNEEKSLLALATDKDQKHTIQEEFQLLLKVLTGEVQLDKGVIDQIKKQEKAQVALIRLLYKAKIKELQNLIHALEHKR